MNASMFRKMNSNGVTSMPFKMPSVLNSSSEKKLLRVTLSTAILLF